MLTTKIKRKISERERHIYTHTNKQISSFFEKNDERESNHEKRLLLRIIISIIIRELCSFAIEIYAYICMLVLNKKEISIHKKPVKLPERERKRETQFFKN